MAYIDQDRKRELAPAIKKILKANGLSGTLSIRNNSTLVLTIRSGWLDFIGNRNKTVAAQLDPDDQFIPAIDYMQVNEYRIDSYFSGEAKRILNDLKSAMMVGNWDHSDSQTDYFNVGWYITINIGRYDRPYRVI